MRCKAAGQSRVHSRSIGTLSKDDEEDDDDEYVCAKSGSRPWFTSNKRAGKCELKLRST